VWGAGRGGRGGGGGPTMVIVRVAGVVDEAGGSDVDVEGLEIVVCHAEGSSELKTVGCPGMMALAGIGAVVSQAFGSVERKMVVAIGFKGCGLESSSRWRPLEGGVSQWRGRDEDARLIYHGITAMEPSNLLLMRVCCRTTLVWCQLSTDHPQTLLPTSCHRTIQEGARDQQQQRNVSTKARPLP
jgi:hypothetical protein